MQIHTTKIQAQPNFLLSPLLLAAFVLGAAQLAHAQSMVSPAVNTSNLTTPVDNQTSSSTAPAPATGSGTATNPLTVGPATFHPQISARYLSTDGLQVQPGRSAKTEIISFSPGISAEIGRHLSLRYIQTLNHYSNGEFRDTIDHAGGINWQTQYDTWQLDASHDYTRSDSSLVETSAQTRQTTHNSSFNALYSLSSEYALDTTLSQNLAFNDLYNDPKTWTAREMLRKKTTPQFDTGIGVEYSYTAIKKSSDIAALRLLANITWIPMDIFNASLEVGLENRRVYTSPSLDKRSPVYNGSLNYLPTKTTQLSLTASRASSASLFENLITVTTAYGLNLQQTVLKRFNVLAACNRQVTDYKSTLQDLATARKDTTDTINLGLSTGLFTKFRLSLTYQYSSNASNILAYKFSTNQYGVELGYSY